LKSIITVISVFLMLITGIWFYSSKYEKHPEKKIENKAKINSQQKEYEDLTSKSNQIAKEASEMLPVTKKEEATKPPSDFEEDFVFNDFSLKGSKKNILVISFSLNKDMTGVFDLSCTVSYEDEEQVTLNNTFSNEDPDVTHFDNFLVGKVKTPVKEVTCELLTTEEESGDDPEESKKETEEASSNSQDQEDTDSILDMLDL